MPRKPRTGDGGGEECCSPVGRGILGYKVEAIVALDSKGQLLIPKDVRGMIGARPGDKLVVVSSDGPSGVCCLHIFKAESFTTLVREMLGPASEELRA